MSRSRKRKLLSKCLRSKLNGYPKSLTAAAGVRTATCKITANRLLFASVAALLGILKPSGAVQTRPGHWTKSS